MLSAALEKTGFSKNPTLSVQEVLAVSQNLSYFQLHVSFYTVLLNCALEGKWQQDVSKGFFI